MSLPLMVWRATRAVRLIPTPDRPLNSLPSCSLIVVAMHRSVTGRPFGSQLRMASRSMAKNAVTRALLKQFQSHHSAACAHEGGAEEGYASESV